MPPLKTATLSVISLGCPKTLVDTERALGFLKKTPVRMVDKIEGSDCVLINTCAFIESASQESIDTILNAVRLKKDGSLKKIIVTGCLPQRYGQDLVRELEEVDAFLGTDAYHTLPETLARVLQDERVTQLADTRTLYDELSERSLFTATHTAYLKIAEGCDKKCTFCTIPFIRGGQRSRTIESLVREAEGLAAQGVKELVLVSQNTTSFGFDRGRPELARLLKSLARVPGVRWIRFLYNYPDDFGEEVIEALHEEEALVPYVDLPLQHVSDRILRRMARPMGRAAIEELLQKIRKRVPDVAIRTQFIVGFPGEGEEEFTELCGFLNEWKFERLGLFMFSKEEGTPSARLDGQVSDRVKEERFDRASLLQREVSTGLNARLMGREVLCLVDETAQEKGVYLGRTAWDAPEVDGQVFIHSEEALHPGDFVRVRIEDTLEYDLVGRALRTGSGQA
ncbi:MAG: 30S ribosomal protein S12 methylthiotransferase RimO [Candidatus Omnitrophica bacterium]|nr:30S ribosomal protein S12 methylthiotransferase RimO [Candidatus Omnitrophota bacterium]